MISCGFIPAAIKGSALRDVNHNRSGHLSWAYAHAVNDAPAILADGCRAASPVAPRTPAFSKVRRRGGSSAAARSRMGFDGKWLDRLALQVPGLETIGNAAEIPDPAPGLRQRHADVPTAAFARLARLRHHRAKRHQVAGDMIENLRGQFLRAVDPGRLSLRMVEARCGLHQRVKAATFRPWSHMAVGRKRHIDDAWIDPPRLFRREAETGERARAIALRKDIGLRQQFLQLVPALVVLEIDKGRELAAAGIDGEPWDRRQIGAGYQQHVGAMCRQRAAGDGAGDHARQIKHAQTRERPVAARPRFWRGVADFFNCHDW